MSKKCQQMDNELVGEMEAEIADLTAKLAAAEQRENRLGRSLEQIEELLGTADLAETVEMVRTLRDERDKAVVRAKYLEKADAKMVQAEQRASDLAAQVGELVTAVVAVKQQWDSEWSEEYRCPSALGVALYDLFKVLARTPEQSGEKQRQKIADLQAQVGELTTALDIYANRDGWVQSDNGFVSEDGEAITSYLYIWDGNGEPGWIYAERALGRTPAQAGDKQRQEIADLAAQVGELRTALCNLYAQTCIEEIVGSPGYAAYIRPAYDAADHALARTPEQSGEKQRQKIADLQAQVGELTTALRPFAPPAILGSMTDTLTVICGVQVADIERSGVALARTPAQAGERWRAEQAVVKAAQEVVRFDRETMEAVTTSDAPRADWAAKELERAEDEMERAVDALAALEKREGRG